MVIRLVLPDLRTGIVWSAGLCLKEAALGHLAHIQVTHFDCTVFGEEDICTLYVTVDD